MTKEGQKNTPVDIAKFSSGLAPLPYMQFIFLLLALIGLSGAAYFGRTQARQIEEMILRHDQYQKESSRNQIEIVRTQERLAASLNSSTESQRLNNELIQNYLFGLKRDVEVIKKDSKTFKPHPEENSEEIKLPCTPVLWFH